jgi:hypothetical protein
VSLGEGGEADTLAGADCETSVLNFTFVSQPGFRTSHT